jgi:putative transposase
MAVADTCTREILGWEFSPNCATADAHSIVEKALCARFPMTGQAADLVLKPDVGSQFNTRQFRKGLRTLGTHLAVSRLHTPEDSGLPGFFSHSPEGRHLWLREAESSLDIRATIVTSMEDFHEGSPRSSLNYMTPKENFQKKPEKQQA